MLEQQLLETAGDVAHADRRLAGSHVSSLASNRSSSMEYSSDDDGSAQHSCHLASLSAREVEALRVENEAIMKVGHVCVGLAAIGHTENYCHTHTPCIAMQNETCFLFKNLFKGYQ